MADINLLPVEEKGAVVSEGIRKKLSIASAVILVIVAAFGVVTLVLFTNYSAQKQKIQAKIDDATTQINSYKATEELAVVTKDKASIAGKILTQRTDQVDLFNQFAQLVPENVYFSDIKFNVGKASFTGKAKSSADVAGFISALASSDGAKIINNVNIDSLGSDKDGVYSFSISGELASAASSTAAAPNVSSNAKSAAGAEGDVTTQ